MNRKLVSLGRDNSSYGLPIYDEILPNSGADESPSHDVDNITLNDAQNDIFHKVLEAVADETVADRLFY